MIAEQSSDSLDAQLLGGFGWDDLDIDSFKRYRKRFANAKPDSQWNEIGDEEFLKRIGGWKTDRKSGNREKKVLP
ncbi:hypothetical protein SAMN05421687_11416 [Salimicrobium flavidum]|uniref:Uncharacterized protein n=2 Tax=Salimicrobium flavidum TaxID=570947 RepID=A0A1N7KMU6_9BACI|nr:hypothetical protein SAMN05421687_11416 [Salimicrobium flavidum]